MALVPVAVSCVSLPSALAFAHFWYIRPISMAPQSKADPLKTSEKDVHPTADKPKGKWQHMGLGGVAGAFSGY